MWLHAFGPEPLKLFNTSENAWFGQRGHTQTYSQSASALPRSAPEVQSLNENGFKKVYFWV